MECDEKIGARIRQFMDDCNTFYEQGQLSKARDSLFEAWGILPDEKYIYVEPVGDFPYSLSPSRTIFSVTVNKNTEKIFLRDKKGNMRELWDKDNGILLEDKIYMKN